MQPFWISLFLAGSAVATPLANGVAERDQPQLEARGDDDLWYRAECWDTSLSASAGTWGRSAIFRYNLWLSKATCDKSGYNWHTSGSCIRDGDGADLYINGPQWWNDCKAVASTGYTDYRHPEGDNSKWEEYTRTIPADQVEGRGFDEAHNAPGK